MQQQPGDKGSGGQGHQRALPQAPTGAVAAHLNGRRVTHNAQMRRNTSVPLVPPKPKLFFTATSIFIGRASLAQ